MTQERTRTTRSVAGIAASVVPKSAMSPREYASAQSIGSASMFVSQTDSQTPRRREDTRCFPNVISKQMRAK